MVEYHVDAYREFQEKMNKETKFGGNQSVRLKKEEKLLVTRVCLALLSIPWKKFCDKSVSPSFSTRLENKLYLIIILSQDRLLASAC